MTIAELIQALAIYPDDTEVVLASPDAYVSIEYIVKKKVYYNERWKDYSEEYIKVTDTPINVIVLE